jgi:hypothetical protein
MNNVKCPLCGEKRAFQLLNKILCSEPKCSNYDKEQLDQNIMQILARISSKPLDEELDSKDKELLKWIRSKAGISS